MISPQLDHLSGRDFQRLAKFIHEYSGIKMPATKQTMVEGRLRKRVGMAGFASLTAYCRHLFDEGGLATEAVHLIDLITTNKTDFFREPDHFQFLADIAVPQILADRRRNPHNPIKLWSSACSIGAEPYTLAMVMSDLAQHHGGFRIEILATDISTRVLETAATAIYSEAMIAPIPMDMRKRYLLRTKDRTRQLVRIAPDMRRLVHFGRLNLMDQSYPVDRGMDVIFCRNILIYFDKPTQQMILARLCDHLRPGGFLFLGHSETLAGFGLPVTAVGATVFRRE
jgi:chemotaxis protein methyltransferase CheR